VAFRKRSADPEFGFVRNLEVTIDGVLSAGSKIARSHSSVGAGSWTQNNGSEYNDLETQRNPTRAMMEPAQVGSRRALVRSL